MMHNSKKAAAQTAANIETQSNIITSIEIALNNNFKELKKYKQFVVYMLVPNTTGKTQKIPVNSFTGDPCDYLNPANLVDSDTAINCAHELEKKINRPFAIGFVLTKNDPFFFIDIDNCLEPCGTKWSSLGTNLCSNFQNAALEVSNSQRGLHIFGTYSKQIQHKCKNTQLSIELYTENRFVALTGYHACGDISYDHTESLQHCVDQYFKPEYNELNSKENHIDDGWSNEAVAEWNGYQDNNELIQKALASKSSRNVFGSHASFQDLWEGNQEKLALSYPSKDGRPYDSSSADAALAQHLAFWTGNNPERMLHLMLQSKLKRDKWDRKDYLSRTIRNACRLQKTWHNRGTHALEQPESLPCLPAVMPFNYSYLPNILCEYVRDISERMQCPPDFAAIATLIMMATLIGRKVGIRPKCQDNWTVIPNLWGMVIGNSGVMKSPALKEALAPLKKLEANAYQVFNKQLNELELEEEFVALQKSKKRSEAKKALNKKSDEEIKSLLKSNRISSKPVLKRFTTNNSSYEALGEILIENPNGILVEADELIGLFKQLDGSGQEAARSFYLTGADGDKPYTFDRIMRGKGLHIEAISLSILGGIQPGLLADYVRQAINGAEGADGLMQRFSMAVYPDISPVWKDVDRLPNSSARKDLNTLVEKLNNLTYIDIGAEIDPYGGIPFIRFNDEAQFQFSKWRSELEHRLRADEEHPAMISHLSKYRKLVPALALINHLCENGYGKISETSLQRAIDFTKYLESHARRIYSFATRPDIDAAKLLLKHLSKGKLSSPFTTRDIYRNGWAGLTTSQKARAAVEVLLEYGHLKEEQQSTGGREKILYHWIKSKENN